MGRKMLDYLLTILGSWEFLWVTIAMIGLTLTGSGLFIVIYLQQRKREPKYVQIALSILSKILVFIYFTTLFLALLLMIVGYSSRPSFHY